MNYSYAERTLTSNVIQSVHEAETRLSDEKYCSSFLRRDVKWLFHYKIALRFPGTSCIEIIDIGSRSSRYRCYPDSKVADFHPSHRSEYFAMTSPASSRDLLWILVPAWRPVELERECRRVVCRGGIHKSGQGYIVTQLGAWKDLGRGPRTEWILRFVHRRSSEH